MLATAVVRGLGSALVVSLLTSALLGTIYYLVPFGDGVMSGLLIATNIAALLWGGLAAARASHTHGWLNGGLAGVFYMVSLWMVQSLGFVSSEGLTILAAVIALSLGAVAGGIGGMLGMAVAD